MEFMKTQATLAPAVFHLVQSLPVGPYGDPCPCLFIEINEVMKEHVEASRWARSNLSLNNRTSINTDLKVLGRLHDYHQVAWLGEPIRNSDRRLFIMGYLEARLRGTATLPTISRLNWTGAPYTTVRSDFRTLVRYFQFQHEHGRWKDEGFESLEAIKLFAETLRRSQSATRRDFFAHLELGRTQWASLFGVTPRMPRLEVQDTSARHSAFSIDRTMDLEEIHAVINAEQNPVYKAIWILAAFGGPRCCEMLHMWQCDVLPASSGELITGYQLTTPLVLIAHPSESRYTGNLAKLGPNRLQFLASRHGLQPRTMMSGYRRLGWKHPLETYQNLRSSQVFWSDETMAHAFVEAYAEVRRWHSKNRTSENHPWLWVNLTKGLEFGLPVAASQLRKAFGRACKRVGLDAGVAGRRLHGLRHAYKHQLEKVGLERAYIQIAMRHKSIESQDDYGRTGRELRRLLGTSLNRAMP